MNYPNRIIKVGETDSELVKQVQARLNAEGCGPLQGTGSFGAKTREAVKQFQATHRDQFGNPLEVDGKIGSITWAILFNQPVAAATVETVETTELAKAALAEAVSNIGVMEKPPGSNRGPEVDAYLACVSCPPGNYWCAGFVYSCFDAASKKLGVKNPLVKTAGCIDHWNRSKAKKIATKDAIDNPSLIKPGDIFILDFGGGKGHTGMVEKVDGGFLNTIEGNSNNDGSRNGIGVFRLRRKINKISKGFLQYQ